jgi:hypothetical protein
LLSFQLFNFCYFSCLFNGATKTKTGNSKVPCLIYFTAVKAERRQHAQEKKLVPSKRLILSSYRRKSGYRNLIYLIFYEHYQRSKVNIGSISDKHGSDLNTCNKIDQVARWFPNNSLVKIRVVWIQPCNLWIESTH